MSKHYVALETLVGFRASGRKGAPYTIDGVHNLNGGDLAECLLKSYFGFKAEKDASTPFYIGADIPELNMSVKSFSASIPKKDKTARYATVAEYADAFTADDVATVYAYVKLETDCMIYYTLSKELMNEMIKKFGKFDGDKVRLPKDKRENLKMEAWLDRNARA